MGTKPSASLLAGSCNQLLMNQDAQGGLTFWKLLAEYDFMAPPREKRAEAVAFISNCGAQSFRLEAVQQLGATVQVHSYGACEHNADTNGASKEDLLPSYHFTLAFENSQARSAARDHIC